MGTTTNHVSRRQDLLFCHSYCSIIVCTLDAYVWVEHDSCREEAYLLAESAWATKLGIWHNLPDEPC